MKLVEFPANQRAIPWEQSLLKRVITVKLSDEERRYALNEYLRQISHIQDRDYQIRIWIRGEGPECQAFDDAVCDFFDIGDPLSN